MYLTRHRCADFRNIGSLSLEPSRGVNVICGENGHGKTNLLESLFLLTGARSFRMAKDIALIKNGAAAARISSGFFSEGRAQTLELTIDEKGRSSSLNSGSAVKASAAAGAVRCVIFCPENLELVKGSPEKRRRFIDTALCQLSAAYLSGLRVYTRVLNQRNSLLRDCAYVSAASEMLEVYDERLAQSAAAICSARAAFVSELLPLAAERYAAVSSGREALDFHYCCSLFGAGEISADAALAAIADFRREDIRSGCTQRGPHRDDVVFSLSGADARAFASQGQQRCVVLALKLAEARLMERRGDEKPILLLDDVLSELDERRRDCLIGGLEDAQAFITCCEPDAVLERYHSSAKVFRMENGALEQL